MNLLHLSTAKGWRGGEQQLLYLAEELTNQSNIKQIVYTPKHSILSHKANKKGISIITYVKRTSLDIFSAYRLKKICSKQNIQIIHTHDAHSHTTAILSALLFNNKPHIVVSRRVDFPIKKSWFSLYKYNHPKIAKIICVSNAIKVITSSAIKDKSKLTTIYSGIDLSRFEQINNNYNLREEFKIPNEKIIIGNTSALAPHKDYYTFVKAAKEIIKKGIPAQFIIVGEGKLSTAIKEYIAQQEMNKYFILTGFRKDVLNLLNGFDLFLITSETEGLGTSILDAFALKKPVVATQAGGIPEIVIHNQTGLLAPIKNPKELANNVEQIINNKELKNSLITEAHALVKEFDKKNTALKTLQIYQNLPL